MKLTLPTADGEFLAHYSKHGLAQLDFPGDHRKHTGDADAVPQAGEWHALTAQALNGILAGRDPVALPPLDVSGGSRFQRRVWEALRQIPAGRTKSYGEIAEAISDAGAARAVGAACGANPIPVIIPCHRVLAANGRLGGFSSGLDWKRKLLAREGVKPVEKITSPPAAFPADLFSPR
jgi:O-6-methylguanine DNA methyltransferase